MSRARARAAPPAPSPRELRRASERAERITRILDAAMVLAVEHGIAAVTTTRLARELGYTVGAFYRYFPSIEALLAALHRRTAEVFYADYFASLAPARIRLAAITARRGERVRALAEVALLAYLYRALALAHPRRFELVGQLLTQRWTWIDAPLQRGLDALVMPHITEIVRIVTAASGPAPSPVHATMSLWLAVHAALAIGPLAERHPALLDPAALWESALRTQLRGWGASPTDVDAAMELAARAVAGEPSRS